MVRPDSNNESGDCDSSMNNNVIIPEVNSSPGSGVTVTPKSETNNSGVDNSPGETGLEMPMLGEGDSTPRAMFSEPPQMSHDAEFDHLLLSEETSDNLSSELRTSFFSSRPFSRNGSCFEEGNGSRARRFISDYGISSHYPDSGSGQRRITSNDEPKPNLIVNYLPQNFSDKEFFNLFAPYGVMESIKIMRDSQTGYSFGYGFVNYIDLQDAIDARNELNGKTVGHKRIKVSFARPPSDDIKDTNLFVTGLSTNITEEELDHMFSPFGVIVHLRVLRDRQTKATRGVAFVRYETRSEACTAILEMNGVVPKGASEPIRVRLAQDHGKQKAAYLAGYQDALKMKGGVGLRGPEVPYRHSESAFNLRSRNLMVPGRGRPLTACVGEGIRITTSSSDPTLYWKGFMQGAREPRRPETSAGSRTTRPNSRSGDSHRY